VFAWLVGSEAAHRQLVDQANIHPAHLRDQHRIPDLMRDAGFAKVSELPPRGTILGRVSYWRAAG